MEIISNYRHGFASSSDQEILIKDLLTNYGASSEEP